MVVLLAIALAVAAPASPDHPPGIPRAQQERLARFFAPTLVFHPDEAFLPCAPAADPPLEPGDAAPASFDAAIARYRQLPREARTARAVVFYRVTRTLAARRRVMVEYFFYYLGNPYRSRGGIAPFHFTLWHPRDLEHALVAVEFPASADPADAPPELGRIAAVYPSAHGAAMPDNVKHAPAGEPLAPPVRLLVELGSHAMAVDVNGDGVFTPGLDADGPRKFTWGIRDHGAPWAWYRPSYADRRGPSAVVLGPADYRLEPAEALESGLAEERSRWPAAGDSEPSWGVRWFGEFDETTLERVPPPDPRPDASHDERAAAKGERAWLVGGSNLLAPFSLFAGGRWLVPTPWLLPDVLIDGEMVLTTDGRKYSVVDVMAAYRLDFATRVYVGGGPLVRWWSIDRREVEWDWAAGLEFHLGHLRVRQGVRRTGVLNHTAYEARVSWAF